MIIRIENQIVKKRSKKCGYLINVVQSCDPHNFIKSLLRSPLVRRCTECNIKGHSGSLLQHQT